MKLLVLGAVAALFMSSSAFAGEAADTSTIGVRLPLTRQAQVPVGYAMYALAANADQIIPLTRIALFVNSLCSDTLARDQHKKCVSHAVDMLNLVTNLPSGTTFYVTSYDSTR